VHIRFQNFSGGYTPRPPLKREGAGRGGAGKRVGGREGRRDGSRDGKEGKGGKGGRKGREGKGDVCIHPSGGIRGAADLSVVRVRRTVRRTRITPHKTIYSRLSNFEVARYDNRRPIGRAGGGYGRGCPPPAGGSGFVPPRNCLLYQMVVDQF
jgi:hypothetical protein